jgi:hypothetical protein
VSAHTHSLSTLKTYLSLSLDLPLPKALLLSIVAGDFSVLELFLSRFRLVFVTFFPPLRVK